MLTDDERKARLSWFLSVAMRMGLEGQDDPGKYEAHEAMGWLLGEVERLEKENKVAYISGRNFSSFCTHCSAPMVCPDADCEAAK